MYEQISTPELIKYLILALFDGNDNNPEIRPMIDEVKRRVSSTPSASVNL